MLLQYTYYQKQISLLSGEIYTWAFLKSWSSLSADRRGHEFIFNNTHLKTAQVLYLSIPKDTFSLLKQVNKCLFVVLKLTCCSHVNFNTNLTQINIKKVFCPYVITLKEEITTQTPLFCEVN